MSIITATMKRIVFVCRWAVVAALFMTAIACTAEPEGKTDEDSVRIPINISMGMWTKVTDVAYEHGDQTGIYVVNNTESGESGTLVNSGNHVDNMRFTYDGVWTPDSEIYWKDKETKADFYCYYPYGTPTDVAAYPFSVQADQSALESYKASEFLWSKATGVSPTDEAVPIITNRSMSNMLIYLQPGNGFTEETFAAASKSVRICNVKIDATVDLRTGVATAIGSNTEVVPYNEGGYYRALIVPQTVGDGLNLITVTVDGVDYTFAKGFTFEPNVQHKFTIAVNKSSGGVDITIGGWESDGEDHGGSAE